MGEGLRGVEDAIGVAASVAVEEHAGGDAGALGEVGFGGDEGLLDVVGSWRKFATLKVAGISWT